MKNLLLCAILLGGCAASTLLPSLPHMQPLQAQFGLRFRHAGLSVPLQGAVNMTGNEGSLGVIFPHGRTLGVCRYQGGGMECAPTGEGGSRARFMLRQIGLAVYRSLPALAREPAQDIAGTDWTVYWKETDAGRSVEYRDLAGQVTMEMHFTEIVRP
ncbi:MAG: hypothetical protein LBC79_03080 [Deltaproteobacteria bacterium]|jgi:hypothetical protein|nr:hypothetical protein [Deltaproteobacteria bacterium]